MPKLGYYEMGVNNAVCTNCGNEKDISFFYFSKTSKKNSGIIFPCKSCCSERAAKAYIKNKEKFLSRNKAWAMKNPEKRRLSAVRSRLNNSEMKNASTRKWREKNKEYDAFRSKTRKAKKMQAIPLWANEFFIKEAYQLAKIRSDATGIRWCVDHIVPLVSKFVCGLHCEQNIQLLPESINQSKGNRFWPDMPNA